MAGTPTESVTVDPITDLFSSGIDNIFDFVKKIANPFSGISMDSIRKRLAENLYPIGYIRGEYLPGNERMDKVFDALKGEPWDENLGEVDYSDQLWFQERVDLLHLLMGQKQKHNTMQLSEYTPTVGHEKGDKYYRSKTTEEGIRQRWEYIYKQLKSKKPSKRGLKSIVTRHWGPTVTFKDGTEGDVQTLGESTYSLGKDERGEYISYYDVWDITPYKGDRSEITRKEGPSLRLERLLGLTPPKVYGRIYLDELKKGSN